MQSHDSIYAGYNAYRTYLAIKSHFELESYDYFKYNGKVRVTEESFLKRNDKYFFHRLEAKHTHQKLVTLFVSNKVLGGKMWVRELSADYMVEWERDIARLPYLFENDMRLLVDHCHKTGIAYDDIFDINLKKIGISGYSIAVLDWLFKFTDKWLECDNIVLETSAKEIQSMRGFVVLGYDKNVFRNIVRKVMNDGKS